MCSWETLPVKPHIQIPSTITSEAILPSHMTQRKIAYFWAGTTY